MLNPHCYRETLVAVIRDVGHAYLALSDRKDWTACVSTIDATYTMLTKAGDATVLPRVRKETGIGTESALRTLAGLVRIAERAVRQFDEIEEGYVPPDALERLVEGQGRKTLLVLAVGLNSFLCEDNVWRIRLRANSSIN